MNNIVLALSLCIYFLDYLSRYHKFWHATEADLLRNVAQTCGLWVDILGDLQ